MRKHYFLVAFAALTLAVAAWASDPWKDKPYDSWDAKDIERILNDSPWSRQFTVGLLQSSGGRPDTTINSGENSPMGSSAGGEGGGGGRRGGRGGGGAAADLGGDRQQIYIARWFSSRTIRVAEARSRSATGDQIKEVLAAAWPTYRIVIGGADLRAFAAANPDDLRAKTWLELKKSHQKLVPVSITLARGQDGGRVVALVVDFPRKTDSGEPAIGAGEKDVEFVTSSGPVTLKFKYDLSKMADKDGSDL